MHCPDQAGEAAGELRHAVQLRQGCFGEPHQAAGAARHLEGCSAEPHQAREVPLFRAPGRPATEQEADIVPLKSNQ